ncbi:anthranilate synthase component 1 [Shewanella sp. NIFS-20-20]|uniref:anthranilate synthase component 1 n=1 Tax=Shewanella sp. NIFS-20-20 TaxID=2853806 RepID=UPI001C48B685|nr:anthranilate synthase component 1 [Shewanella sp. NIFS-20-20]MBV7315043.1 anthranilate synthase component 1 [Shewanella sp. NIFS-20-20]
MTSLTGKFIRCERQPVRYQADPLCFYQALNQDNQHHLLLESAEVTTKQNLKSLLLCDSALQIRCQAYDISFTALSQNGMYLLELISQFFAKLPQHRQQHTLVIHLSKDEAPMDEDARLLSGSPLDGLRFFISELANHCLDPQSHHDIFLGGVLAYDLIATTESLSQVATGANHCPDYVFYLAEQLIVIDHQTQTAQLQTFTFSMEAQVDAQLKQRQQRLIALAAEEHPAFAEQAQGVAVTVNVSDSEYCQQVEQLKQHIVAGNIFQVVPSRSFSLACPNPFGAYRALRRTNPSPYMFFFQADDFCLFGASPESALKYHAHTGTVEVYPIAGTRPRGKHHDGSIDADLDSRIELELRLDKKELSEHLMLVDLARNDIARISQAGSRKVAELLKVDRYSHVMHLVSRVTGQLKPELDALHAYQACMNMGTLVGAPKIRAAQLIRETEQQRRGSYGGAVGYLNGRGDMDTCIVIRSAFVSQDVAHIQAGAGVVFDSDPQAEADETRQKAQAVINAVLQGGGQ